MPMRSNSRPRIRLFNALANSSASANCGSVAMTNMPIVLYVAFQKPPLVNRKP